MSDDPKAAVVAFPREVDARFTEGEDAVHPFTLQTIKVRKVQWPSKTVIKVIFEDETIVRFVNCPMKILAETPKPAESQQKGQAKDQPNCQ